MRAAEAIERKAVRVIDDHIERTARLTDRISAVVASTRNAQARLAAGSADAVADTGSCETAGAMNLPADAAANVGRRAGADPVAPSGVSSPVTGGQADEKSGEESGRQSGSPLAADAIPGDGLSRLPEAEREANGLPAQAGLPGSAAGPANGTRRRLHRLAGDSWHLNGRDEQKPPPGDWRTWLVMGGRGSGKTRAGAEWVHDLATRSPLRIALVAETLADAREVMVDGVSGLWRIARFRRPSFEISRRRLVWPNGSVAQLFSSEDPESLRGPQFDLAWCDELGKWKHARETWDMLQFGLRLGTAPRQVVTTTPRAIPLLKAILADPGTVATKLSTLANAGNLAPGFIRAMEARYGGTRLGRQELDGELIEDRDDALWNRDLLERLRIRAPGPLGRIVVAVDPPAAERARNSCCGIVVAGVDASGRAAVIADLSVANASPGEWGAAVARAYRRFQADRVVAEVNQGGDMVTAILHAIDAGLPVTTVRATRGKYLRAEPVVALYEQGRVAHAGIFPKLEDQMCDFGPDGLSGGASPDRLDALVWALTALMLSGQGEPRVRGM